MSEVQSEQERFERWAAMFGGAFERQERLVQAVEAVGLHLAAAKGFDHWAGHCRAVVAAYREKQAAYLPSCPEAAVPGVVAALGAAERELTDVAQQVVRHTGRARVPQPLRDELSRSIPRLRGGYDSGQPHWVFGPRGSLVAGTTPSFGQRD